MVSTVDVTVYDDSRAGTMDRLVRQFTSPVRLRDAIGSCYARGARNFFEAGPKWPVTGYVRETLGERPFTAQASIHPKVGELVQLHRLLACAFVAGAGRLDLEEQAQVAAEAKSAPAMIVEDRTASMEPAALTPTAHAAQILEVPTTTSESPALANPPAVTRSEPTPPSAVAPAATAPSRPSEAPAELFERVRAMVVTAMAERTGYPVDMLELDLDLEGDLGIDTVKQVEVLARVREQLGLVREQGLSMRELSTLRKAIARFVTRLGGTVPSGANEAAPSFVSAASPVAPPPSTIAAAIPATNRPPRNAELFEKVSALMVRAMAERTGYPLDMLELDLDLEGDLGIDTVKQVEVFGRVREELGLVREPGLSMRELCTLRKAAERFVRRLEAVPAGAKATTHPPSPHASSSHATSSHEVAPVIALRSGHRPTGPIPSLPIPPSSPVFSSAVAHSMGAGHASHASGPLAVPAKSSLAASTMATPVSSWAGALAAFAPAQQPYAQASEALRVEVILSRHELPPLEENLVEGTPCVPLGTLWESLEDAGTRLLGRPPRAATALQLHRLVRLPPEGRARLRLDARHTGAGRVHAELHHAGDGALLASVDLLAEPEQAQPETEAQIDRARSRARTATPRHSITEGAGEAELIEVGGVTLWVRPLSFCEFVGAVAVSAQPGPARARATLPALLLDSATMLAGYAWFALVGHVGVPAGIESLALARSPVADEPLTCHLRLRQATSGSAMADVVVLGSGGDRALVARITGLRLTLPSSLEAAHPGDARGTLSDFQRALRERSANGRG